MVASSQVANRAWSSARSRFGSASYAASRMRMCRNRNVSSPLDVVESGRMSSRRTRSWSRAVTIGPLGLRGELRDRDALEHAADDRRPFGELALDTRQAIEPRGEQRRDRRRDMDRAEVARRSPAVAGPDELAILHEHRDDVLDEQRIAFGDRLDPGQQRLVHLAPEQGAGQGPRVLDAETLQQDRLRIELATAPGRADIQEVRAGDGDDQDRLATAPVDQVLDEIEERRLGPVEIVEQHDHGLARRDGLEEATHSPEHVLARRVTGHESDRGGDPVSDLRAIPLVGHECTQLGQRGGAIVRLIDPGCGPDDLGDRPVCDPLAVGQASPAQDRRPVADAADQLEHEPALAHAGRAEEREQAAPPLREGILERPEQAPELPLATHQRRIEMARGHDAGRVHRDDAPRHERLALALGIDRRRRLGRDRVADQPIRLGADEDRARRRVLLQASGHVHGVTGHESLSVGGLARDDLAGVDAGPRDEALGEPELAQSALELVGCPDGPERVVLVEGGQAEHRHHGIPDELLHDAAVTLDDGAREVEVFAHQRSQALGIEPLPERCRAGDIDEHDGHGPPGVAAGACRHQSRPAAVAETRARRVAGAAARAHDRLGGHAHGRER